MTFGRLFVVDVHHHAQRQDRLVGVLGDQVDRFERFVVAVPFALAGDPVQDEIGRRHADDLAGVGVEGIFARPEGRFPDAPFAAVDAFAVAES